MTHHICTMTEIILISTGTWKHFLRYMYQKMLPAMFMNITTHPYHLTEFKLCCVRDPSGICRRQINKHSRPQSRSALTTSNTIGSQSRPQSSFLLRMTDDGNSSGQSDFRSSADWLLKHNSITTGSEDDTGVNKDG